MDRKAIPELVMSTSEDTAFPERIGPYEVVGILGRGSMGIVYHGRQTEPIRRDVAIKVIRLGMDTERVIARFESERQALAMMDHSHIARFFDAGAASPGRIPGPQVRSP